LTPSLREKKDEICLCIDGHGPTVATKEPTPPRTHPRVESAGGGKQTKTDGTAEHQVIRLALIDTVGARGT